ncbi:MAG: beta-galactosidase [Anaerolineae bacterium]|nr:beta-galactosidase [Anaerolineae bacterium]
MIRKLSHKRSTNLPRFYLGVAYYPEHWDAVLREEDPSLMVQAGLNVVRMAEFAWDILEPVEGTFCFDLFDETIARLGDHGIATILCTPTAAPPRWLTAAHPEVLRVDENGMAMQHGSRQHACDSSEVFRDYSRKITQAMAQHYRDNPHVIGWQTDNEFNCHFAECHCAACQAAYREFLREKYTGDIAVLNAAWGTAFWAQTYRSFDEIVTPKSGKPADPNPGQRLDYFRFISWSVSRFQHDQVALLREANPGWFVTHNGTFRHIDYRGTFGEDLDFLSYDVYPFFDRDPHHRPLSQAFNLDQARAWSGNFLIPEQQSGPGGQATYLQDNPEPDEIRRMGFTSIAHGADGILFFRWRTCRFGAEEYWCGILDHDNVPRRRYNEIKKLGQELQTIGPEIMGTHVHVDVGIAAADMDVYDAHDTYSLGLPTPKAMAIMIHEFYFQQGYAVGCVHPADDLGGLKLYILPHWALFNPDWMPNLETYVENGGVLVIGARSGTKDWNNAVVAETPPGVLRTLAGVKVGEYGRQNAPDRRPLTISFPKLKIATEHWYEALELLPNTVTIGRWEGGHLNRLPAVTMHRVGMGAVIYVGTYLTPDLLNVVTALCAELKGLEPLLPEIPEGLHVTVRENDEKRVWFFSNDSNGDIIMPKIPLGIGLRSGRAPASHPYLKKHDVLLVKEMRKVEAHAPDAQLEAGPPLPSTEEST